MSETKHTPEPWEVVGKFSDRIYHAASDTVVAQAWYPGGSDSYPAETMHANARRIVACVNACAGIPTGALEKLKTGELCEVFFDRWEAD